MRSGSHLNLIRCHSRCEVTNMSMTHGTYTRDFFIFPTIVIHNGDDIYFTVELAWLKWYVGVIKK